MVAPSEFPQRYAEIAAANFTVILGGFGAKTPAARDAQIAAAAKEGLGVIAAYEAGLAPNPPPAALWGYQIKDEPHAYEFPGLKKTLDEIAAAQPGMLRFINLLPNYASSTNATNYGSYVDRFVSTVEPDLLSFDSYPNFAKEKTSTSNITKHGYRANLAVMRARGLAAGIPWWNFFSTMPVFGEGDPTEAQLRWQVYTSLAYGATGFMYFCYWSVPSVNGGVGGGIISPTGVNGAFVRTQHYAEAARLNTAVLAWEQHLMGATSTGAWYVEGRASLALPAACALAAINATAGAGPPVEDTAFLVGQFVLADGRMALMLVNQADRFAAWPTLGFRDARHNAPGGGALEVSQASGEEVALADASPGVAGMQVSLAAGGALLIVLPSS